MSFDPVVRRLCTSGIAIAASSGLWLMPSNTAAQTDPCVAPYATLPAGCEPLSAGEVTTITTGENTEPVSLPASISGAGFSLTINGQTLVSDRTVESIARQADIKLADADIRVSFDGLGHDPRLDLEISGTPRIYGPGDRIQLQSALNYPAYVSRGEIRFIDRAAPGGPKTIMTAPITPNGQANVTVPEGRDIYVVHRVYDEKGRYDETAPLRLAALDQRPLADGVEDGSDNTIRRRIPVHGGAVTISGSGVVPGATVTAMGERVATDGSGGFVIQRILPPGDYGIDVKVNGAGQSTAIVRDVEVPSSQWIYVGTADLTYGIRNDDGDRSTYDRGRLAFFADGRTATGFRITASADTGEDEVSELFHRLNKKDPQSVLDQIDPDDLYPTYGDDSTIEDRTPTSGAIFLRVERDGNYLQWGDFDAELGGSDLVRNDRNLYGFSGYWGSPDQTSFGEPKAALLAYGAKPDQLPQRDVFLGTGGSVYFLDRQELTNGTENLFIQLRDPDTGRVIETTPLVVGRDYQINYVQGIVTLTEPLQSGSGTRLGGGDSAEVVLVAQYEYTPAISDVDGYAYGGRAEAWLNDQWRVGVSGMVEQTGVDDQSLVGVDLMYRLSENSYVKAEVAKSDGPGFGSNFSSNGGLVFDSIDGARGSGTATKIDASFELADLGIARDGNISAYFEERSEGFSSLDTQVTDTTGNETFWGIAGQIAASEAVDLSFAYDSYENEVGEFDKSAAIAAKVAVTERLTVAAGLGYEDKKDISGSETENGNRTTISARAHYELNDRATIYGFGRSTITRDGLEADDRIGLGGSYRFSDNWTATGEVSDGDKGVGGRLLASYSDEAGNTFYLGYELEPGREVAGRTLSGQDRGQVVSGGRRVVNEQVTVFGEGTYDVFGDYRSLTQSYGLTFEPVDAWSSTVAIEVGQVKDDFDSDFERRAISLGTRYANEDLTVAGRVEMRRDEGINSGNPLDTDTLFLTLDSSYKIDERQRLVFSFEHAKTKTDESDVLDGTFTELTLGYAFRPIDNDKLNVLARYRYLEDLYGQRVDDDDEDGIRQRSHVLSVDASYDLNPSWTLGGKLGYRLSETSATETDPFVSNDAWLAIANARYHLPHEWDVLLEMRKLATVQSDSSELGVLAAAYKHVNKNVQVGVGYNFGSFSDDLTDLTRDDEGLFLNVVASF
ncbi:outer membrane protein with beta-barrel domain [Primorskyibacter sedentarius]|uniref:Outer membrane protein with beta-barrel domain n=1 Tax=Primorskyibacter sedentarius TaxID=745311 RepID=A0A4R3IP64_9RHOB|nr:TonB-dependent receptor [Primorskyibacter sedentarius]TCS49320.1 outer membrane protein with beta-barrel domain [Primorskyibacter sedentarius]